MANGSKLAKPRKRAPSRKGAADADRRVRVARRDAPAVPVAGAPVVAPALAAAAAAEPMAEAEVAAILIPEGLAVPAKTIDPVASVGPDPAPDAIIRLGAHLTLREAVPLRAELLERVDAVDAVALDASGVQKVDTAGLQVLLVFASQRRSVGADTAWIACSDVLRRAAGQLDLVRALGLPVQDGGVPP